MLDRPKARWKDTASGKLYLLTACDWLGERTYVLKIYITYIPEIRHVPQAFTRPDSGKARHDGVPVAKRPVP